MSSEPTVFIVDDDPNARESIGALVHSVGIHTELFPSAENFLETYAEHRPGCLVADVRMLGMSGLELQEKLTEQKILLPVIILTAYAETALTVRAVQGGAVTVLDKPYKDNDLWDAIRKALAHGATLREKHKQRQAILKRMERLTPEEREVMDLMVAGKANKVIARQLNVSLRTIETRRQQVFSKLLTNSVAELVRMVIQVMPEE